MPATSIAVIDAPRRRRHARALIEMYEQRRRVFVERLGWALPARGWLELDDFDNDDAVYLVAGPRGTDGHLGSVRLLPTTGAHMMAALFAHLCPDGWPCDRHTWEISRLLTDPARAAGHRAVAVHRALAQGLLDFAREHDIRRYVLVAETRRLPELLALGWHVDPLGLPDSGGECPIQAFQITLTQPAAQAAA